VAKTFLELFEAVLKDIVETAACINVAICDAVSSAGDVVRFLERRFAPKFIVISFY
jgi:hypothetical protein